MSKYVDLLKSSLGYHLERTGMSYSDLARRMGDHPAAIGRWIRGERNPTLDKLGKMSEAFGISLSALLLPPGEGKPVDGLPVDVPQNVHLTYKDCLDALSGGLLDLEKPAEKKRRNAT